MEKLSKNLYDFAGKRGAGFDLQSVKDITLNILKGVQKLHSQNITHYDLKPENVLFI